MFCEPKDQSTSEEELFKAGYRAGFRDGRSVWQDSDDFDPDVAWLRYQQKNG